MDGIDLVRALSAGVDVGPELVEALHTHLATGDSLDCILGLKGGANGKPSPRMQILYEARGTAYLQAINHILSEFGGSERQACNLLIGFIDHGVGDGDPALDALVQQITWLSVVIGKAPSSGDSLYKAITDIKYARS